MKLIQSFRCIERVSLHRRLCTEHAHWLPKVVWIGVEYDRSQMQQEECSGMIQITKASDSRVKEKEEEERSQRRPKEASVSLI